VQSVRSMKTQTRTEYVTRESILQLLSDDEVATVSNAETAARLMDGDEYVDLQQLDQGVRRAQKTPVHMGSVLPRKAVQEGTWSKILAQLAGRAAGGSTLPGYT